MAAYYNENDPFAAAWLRNLIAANLIADGEVDGRSIEQVEPADLRGFTQCHFFAGIGVWSYALRRAGWPDAARVWTGSCPCQSFSASGKREGFSDKRHLWPAWFRLIRECKPDVCFGEQVASNDGLSWFDVVSSDMEGEGYTVGAADLCAAGFGAPHIRQRLYFVADSQRSRERYAANGMGKVEPKTKSSESESWRETKDAFNSGPVSIMAESRGEQGQPTAAGGLHADTCSGSAVSGMADTQDTNGRRTGNAGNGGRRASQVGGSSVVGDMAHTGRTEDDEQGNGRQAQPSGNGTHYGLSGGSGSELRQTNGFWADAEWLYCRDKKYRPVEPGTFPLAYGATNRVGRLRGYGNALNAEVAKGFIEAYISLQASDDFKTQYVESHRQASDSDSELFT